MAQWGIRHCNIQLCDRVAFSFIRQCENFVVLLPEECFMNTESNLIPGVITSACDELYFG